MPSLIDMVEARARYLGGKVFRISANDEEYDNTVSKHPPLYRYLIRELVSSRS